MPNLVDRSGGIDSNKQLQFVYGGYTAIYILLYRRYGDGNENDKRFGSECSEQTIQTSRQNQLKTYNSNI